MRIERIPNARSRVVVGVDGSPGADEALRWAVGEAVRRDAILEVTSCWLYSAPVGPGALLVNVHEFPDMAKAVCEKAKIAAEALDSDLVVEI